jgi:hypothetical protein
MNDQKNDTLWLQYFNVEKMARFPNGPDALLTTRMGVYSKLAAVQSAKGGTVFVISGFGKPKRYVLWEAFTIEEVTKQDDQFVVSGPGRVLLPPAPLEGKDFEKFKSACANFIGFRKIDDQPYKDTLKKLADADAKSKLSPKCEAFCGDLIAAFPKMGDAYYYRGHVRQHLGNAAGAKVDYEQALKLGTTFPDEATAGLRQETGDRGQGTAKTASLAAQVVSKGAAAVKAPPGVSDIAWRGVLLRRGGEEFRQKVIAAYGGRCAVTGSDAEATLEVALIDPDGPNEVTNALPLRADIRTLFDLNLLRIHPKTRKVLLAAAVQDSSYARLWARPIRQPASKDDHPGVALLKRWDGLK